MEAIIEGVVSAVVAATVWAIIVRLWRWFESLLKRRRRDEFDY